VKTIAGDAWRGLAAGKRRPACKMDFRGGKGLDHWAKRYGEVIRRLSEGGRVPGGWAALVVGMPHDLAFDQIDHFFGDIGGMIADAFQMA
jgi:hypothetical protein